jgi:hypothetical protein
MKKRQIVNFYELPVKWQKEAIKNLDEDYIKITNQNIEYLIMGLIK